ncbi:MAG: hypothetical protein K8I60_03395 [Anaerolineae bacterium]|nr:hypothetical protein [Anaerolineae bacterium]
MASKQAVESNELKNRFDHFHREARYEAKPYRLLGKAQIINKQVNILIAYPADTNRAAFTETVSNDLKAYGLDPVKMTPQKLAVRVQARLLVVEQETEKQPEADSSGS